MGFRVAALHSGVPDDVAQAVVVLRKEFADGLPPVEQELLRFRRAAEDLARQRRKPREEVIPPPFLELLEHVLCPCHLPGLVTVRQQILDRSAFVDAEKLPEIGLPGLRIEFVHFQARRLRRGRMILLTGQGNAETVDAPASLRHLPDKEAALIDQTEVLHRRHWIRGIGRQVIGEIVRRGKTGLILRVVHFYDTMQDKLRNLRSRREADRQTVPDQRTVWFRIPDPKPEMSGARGGNVHRQDWHDVGRNVAHPPPCNAVIAGFQTVAIGRRVIPPNTARFPAG